MNKRRLLEVIPPCILMGAALLYFYDILPNFNSLLPFGAGSEVFSIFLPYRIFAFDNIARGVFPFWCPAVSCGVPFLANVEAAVFYLPNWVHLVLGEASALNFGMIFHLFIGGFNMYLWSRGRSAGLYPSLFGGIIFMFASPQILMVHTGSLSNLETVVWAPLVFLAVDIMMSGRFRRGIMIGALAGAMQAFAGHAQFLFYTGVISFVYLLTRLPGRRPAAAFRAFGAFIFMYMCAAGAAAAQLLPSFLASRETVRGGHLTYEFASLFSFPPENLFTLIVPDFFGHLLQSPYWGRWFIWEVSVFIGTGALVLAAAGVIKGGSGKRDLAVVLFTVLLALGSYTPFFRFLYGYVPGFDLFRGSSKFIFFAGLLLTGLAVKGLDSLLSGTEHNEKFLKKCALAAAAAAIALAGSMFLVRVPGSVDFTPAWRSMMESIPVSERQEGLANVFAGTDFLRDTAGFAFIRGMRSAAALLLFSAVLFYCSSRQKARALIGAVAAAELLVFAFSYRISTEYAYRTMPPGAERFFRKDPGEFRVLWPAKSKSNDGMMNGLDYLWGQAPPLKRYAEFMFYTQGKGFSEPHGFLDIRRYNMIYSLLRCGYIVVPSSSRIAEFAKAYDGGGVSIYRTPLHFPRAFLVSRWRGLTSAEDVLRELTAEDFDPGREAVYMADEKKRISTGARGRLEIISGDINGMDVSVDVSGPMLLVVTDAYAEGWTAQNIRDGRKYDIVPVDHTLKGVFLEKGKHLIKISYFPPGLLPGAVLSLFSLSALAGLALFRRKL
ncbi:MAG: YfhO family protein [Candidatus Omnitrophica bacterium]|nr:YfhO family protein [Candidatus Omnitrophota bacterium]